MKDSILKKADIVLIVILAAFACSFLFIFNLSGAPGGTALIRVNGKPIGTYDLAVPRIIPVKDDQGRIINTIEIADGQAFMREADCPDHQCIKQGRISHTHETVTCLPNRVVIEIQGGKASEFDGIAQ